MKIDTLQDLEKIIEFVKAHKLDFLEVDNIRIQKTKHDSDIKETNKPLRDLDDALFGDD